MAALAPRAGESLRGRKGAITPQNEHKQVQKQSQKQFLTLGQQLGQQIEFAKTTSWGAALNVPSYFIFP